MSSRNGHINRDVNLRQFIGVPFLNGGRTLAGADCWGLVRLIFAEYGVTVPDYKVDCFASADIGATVDRETRLTWDRITAPVAPCLITMCLDIDVPTMCNHLGVYVGDGYMIHTLNKIMSYKEKIDHPHYKRKIEGFYVYLG